MESRDKTYKRITFRSILIGVMVVVFFVSIIVMYYNMIYKEKRECIIKSGKMAAIKSADQFDRYLSTNIDMINLTSYTLNDMIENHRSDSEIQEYLVGQSTAIKNAVQENSTGLYAYINGRFFSGTNWIPPEGYDSTARPWYTKPMSNPGKLTILEPYLDLQSGNTMLALGKSLCDGVSVLSVDVSLDHMQKLTEEAVENESSDVEMILTGDYTVVTHSDINEVRKNYGSDGDSFGGAIVRELLNAGEEEFEFTYGGKNYVVYDAPFKDNWHCISVNEATEAFSSINSILVATIIVIVVFGLFIGLILTSYNLRNIRAQRAILANEAKSSFLSNMSHEIRTPINAMLGMNEMILRESEDSDILSYSESIKAAGNSLLGIVNDILDFSRIESGKLELIPVSYDLSEMLNDLANLIKKRAEDKGLELVFDFDNNIPKHLLGDAVRIKQIISNILTNAVKYTEKGSVTLKMTYSDSLEPGNIILKVSVEDTGIGIREEDLDRLYTKFERIDEKKNKNIEGTGLGMSITKGLLEMMNSDLSVESVYGQGSKFSFEIEQKKIDDEPLGDHEISNKESLERHVVYRETFRAPKAEILVVDDNPMNLMVFGNLLKRTGVRIDMAAHGDEALELSENKKYDLIFMDHMMPDKDGIETLHELRGRSGNPNVATPSVCLTANAIMGAREQYLAEGFNDYMTKPIDAEKLEGMLINYLPKEKIEIVLTVNDDSENEEEIPGELLPLKDFDAISITEGIKNSGSVGSYISLLKIFYKSMDEKKKEIEQFFADEKLDDYTIRVHALKSSARIIGASAFGVKAEKLEYAGKDGNIAYISEHHASFMEEYESFRAPLSQIFDKKEDEGSKPEAEESVMNEAFSVLKRAAEEMDCDALQNVFTDMEAYHIPDAYRDKWEALKEAADNFDYDMVLDNFKEN